MAAPFPRLAVLGAALALACSGSSPSAEDLGLASHAHGLHATVEPTGVRIHDREPGGATLAEVRLERAGRGGALDAVAPGAVVATPGRIEIRRPGLVEWYANAAEGLEQGFTFEARPPGDAGELVLELAVEEATVLAAGEEVLLVSPVGRRLRYGSLAVYDATGRSLPARLEARADDRIRLLVADEGGVYPIVVDPLLSAVADTRVDSTQAGADLGRSVAGADLNGDGYADLAIGAPLWDGGQLDEGAVFVFYGGPAGLPSSNEGGADLTLQSDQAGARFGSSVAPAGDVNGDGYGDLLVGAPGYDSGELDEGAAFLFHGGPAGLVGSGPATAAARIESEQPGAELGRSVAGAGDTDGDGYADVLVGAELYDGGELDEGAAFLFSGSAAGVLGGGPGAATAWLEPDQAGARFGASVAGAGDVDGDGHADLAVGAPGLDAGQSNEGAAFLYRGGAAGLAPGAPARIESDQGGAGLGSAVAGAGDVDGDGYADLLVGAQGYDAGELDEGSVFFFPGGAAGIAGGSAAGATRIESNQAGAGLGSALAGAGDVNGDGYADVLLVAALYDAPSAGEGAAWLFGGSAAGLPSGGLGPALVRLEGNQIGAELAAAAAGDVDGDGYADVLVGVPRFNGPGSVVDGGLALLFRGANAGIPSAGIASAATSFTGVLAIDHVGWSVAGAGDVNGDGYDDVIVGTPGYDAGQGRASSAVILYGGPDGIPDGTPVTAPTVLQPDPGPGNFGWSVAGAGDVNGDGYADVIVGAPFHVTDVRDEGAAYVFLGGPGGIPSFAPPSARLLGDQPNARLGSAVAGAGDLNGDGYADVVVGAPLYPGGGLALVFHGGADGIADGGPATAATRIESDLGGALLGTSVDGAGDANGDGYGDLIVGARSYAVGGRAFVFQGGPGGIADGTPAAAASVLGPATSNFGASVAGAGDIDGDGYADVLVGAPTTSLIEGRAYLFAGGPGGVSTSPTTTFDTNALGLGQCVAGAGDLNGDGYGDLALGAHLYTGPEDREGAVFVYPGGPSGPSFFNTRLETNLASALFGWSCDGAGDVNGDGFADLIAGGYAYQQLRGAAFVFQGNGGATGRAVLARQLRGDASGLAAEPWGASLDATSFEVRMAATHPEGRGRVRLELEWCPPGVPFGDAACGAALTPGWADSGAAAGGAPLAYRVEGLAAGELYRWRARVLYTPFSVTQPGVVPPAVPPHGPWRRVAAAAEPADVRVGVPAPGCSDGRDDDLDGLVDGDDPGCSGPSDATERDPALPCDDGLDDDADFRRDFPADAGCLSPLDPSEREASRVCDDGLDNDGDGPTDFPADSGCRTGEDASEQPDCADGLDNDLDGLADASADPGCSGPTDGWEKNADVDCDDGVDNDGDGRTDFSTDPDVHDPGCPNPSYYHENPACQDGRDNDGDYWVDFDAGASANGGVPVTEYRDAHCKTAWQEYETGPTRCGLGFELAPLLLALEALRRRRRHPPGVSKPEDER